MKSNLYRWWDREGNWWFNLLLWAAFFFLLFFVGLKPDDPTLEQLMNG